MQRLCLSDQFFAWFYRNLLNWRFSEADAGAYPALHLLILSVDSFPVVHDERLATNTHLQIILVCRVVQTNFLLVKGLISAEFAGYLFRFSRECCSFRPKLVFMRAFFQASDPAFFINPEGRLIDRYSKALRANNW